MFTKMLPAFHPALLLAGGLMIALSLLLRQARRFLKHRRWLDQGTGTVFVCGLVLCLLAFMTGTGLGFGQGNGIGTGSGTGQEEAYEGHTKAAPVLTTDEEAAGREDLILIRVRARNIFLDGSPQKDQASLRKSLKEKVKDEAVIRLQDDYADDQTWSGVLSVLKDLALSYEEERVR